MEVGVKSSERVTLKGKDSVCDCDFCDGETKQTGRRKNAILINRK